MIAYWAILSARFRLLLQYRAAAIAGFLTQGFFGFVRVMIFAGFYESTVAEQPMSHAQVVSYIWLGQALFYLLPFRVDQDIAELIRSGNVAYELARPLDLYNHWLSRCIATRTAPTLLRSVPMFVVAFAWLGLQPPASWASGLMFIASLAGAVLLAGAITVLMSITAIWTIAADGVGQFVAVLAWIFSGIFIPLPLFPDWAQPILNLLPFRGLMDVPFRIYVGHIPAREAGGHILSQLVWTAALVMFGRMIIARGVRRIVVQGG